MKDFFEIPPKHDLVVGSLVTCTCHGGIAVILELYDNPAEVEYPNMNMAKIWWVKLPHKNITRVWMHTIGRLNLYESVVQKHEDLKKSPN